MSKTIFAFSGSMASGKDTAAEYLKQKYQASTYSFSTNLGRALKIFYLDYNRDNLIKISECLRTTFGEDLFAKAMAKDAENDESDLVVVSNVRRAADIAYLKLLPNFVFIKITADPKIRYERLIKRTDKTDDYNKTYEQFLQDHERSTELSILEVCKLATESIDNNGTLEDLYTQLDNLVKKYAKH